MIAVDCAKAVQFIEFLGDGLINFPVCLGKRGTLREAKDKQPFRLLTAGIGHPGQPLRLQAQWRSRARRVRLEFHVRPAPVPDADSIPATILMLMRVSSCRLS